MLKSKTLLKLANLIKKNNGTLYVVGGFVRDLILDKPSKDVDVEVYGLEYEDILNILSSYGTVEAGKEFSVIKFSDNGLDFDVALPRKEVSTGPLHTDFEVSIDPNMKPEEASLRRDFTMNAIMYNPLTHETIDPLGGSDDLKKGILNITSDSSFVDDPLRVLRAFQFISRFNLTPSKNMMSIASDKSFSLSTVSKERLWTEWEKWALSENPDIGLQFLYDAGLLPKVISDLKNTPQDKKWHPEGDVFIHTKQVVKMATWISKNEKLSERDTLILVFSSLCHDFGKPEVTSIIDDKIRAIDHASKGIEPSVLFLKSISSPKWLIDNVVPLVKEHLYHSSFKGCSPKSKAIRKLSVKLEPSNIKMWYKLVSADYSGRSVKEAIRDKNKPPYELKEINEDWLIKAEEQNILMNKPKPVITGVMLIKLGYKQGVDIGIKLRSLFEDQLNGDVDEINAILKDVDEIDTSINVLSR